MQDPDSTSVERRFDPSNPHPASIIGQGVHPLDPSLEAELAAVTAIVRALSAVPQDARRRVLGLVEGMVPLPAPPKRTRKPRAKPTAP